MLVQVYASATIGVGWGASCMLCGSCSYLAVDVAILRKKIRRTLARRESGCTVETIVFWYGVSVKKRGTPLCPFWV